MLGKKKHRKFSVLSSFFVTVVTVVLWALPALATVVVPLTRQELTDRSNLVVRARVGAARSMWNEDHTQIITLTQLQVLTYVKGNGPSVLLVRQFGGSVDGLSAAVPGDGQLNAGDEVVVFLRQGNGVVYLTALSQAVYHVTGTGPTGPIVQRDLSDLTFARLRDGRTILEPPQPEPLESIDHLMEEVAEIAAGAQ